MPHNTESTARAAADWLLAGLIEQAANGVAQIPAQLLPAHAVQGAYVLAIIAVRRANATIDVIAIDGAPDARAVTRFRRFRNMRRVAHSALAALGGLLLPLLPLFSELPELWAAAAPLTAALGGALFYFFSGRWPAYALMDGVARARRLPANVRYLALTSGEWNALTTPQRGQVQRDCIGSGVGLLRVRGDGNVTRLHEPGMATPPRALGGDYLVCYAEGDALRAALASAAPADPLSASA